MQQPEINRTKAYDIALLARAFYAQTDAVKPDRVTDGADKFVELLEACSGNAIFEELRDAIDVLNADEKAVLVALVWVGRGDYYADEWEKALDHAKSEHNEHTALYLISMPRLSDYLMAGLSEFGMKCEEADFESN